MTDPDKAAAGASDSALPSDTQGEPQASAAEKLHASKLASMVMNGDRISGKPRAKIVPLPPIVFRTSPSAYWFTRLYVAVSVLLKLAVSLLDTSSSLHPLLAESGQHVLFAVTLLVILCVVCVLDTAFNDLTSPRVHLPVLRQYRHATFMLMGLGLMSIVSAICAARGFSLLTLVFVVDAAAAVAVAFLDLFARHRKVRTP